MQGHLNKGLLAQLVARSLDMGEVTGSSPVETTNLIIKPEGPPFEVEKPKCRLQEVVPFL